MTDLDRRVATLRGWKPDALKNDPYSPSTNLLHAYKLWNEARPEGWSLWTIQGTDTVWQVGRKLREQAYHAKFVSLTDLPRAITTAWVEAMGAACQK